MKAWVLTIKRGRGPNCVIGVCGVTKDSQKAYVEIHVNWEVKALLANDKTDVKALLQVMETNLRFPQGVFSSHFNEHGNPQCNAWTARKSTTSGFSHDGKKSVVLHVSCATLARHASVAAFLRGRGGVTLEDGGTDFVDQYTFATGLRTATWCTFENLTPFPQGRVSTCPIEGVCDMAYASKDAGPRPNLTVNTFTIRTVCCTKSEWATVTGKPAERNNVRDSLRANPNNPAAQVRVIVVRTSETETGATITRALQLRPADKAVGLVGDGTEKVIWHDSEIALISAFLAIVRAGDILVGFNSHAVHLGYLFTRNELLRGPPLVIGVLPLEPFESFYSQEEHKTVRVADACKKRAWVNPSSQGVLFVDVVEQLMSKNYGNESLHLPCSVLPYADVMDCLHDTLPSPRLAELSGDAVDGNDLCCRDCATECAAVSTVLARLDMLNVLVETAATTSMPVQQVCTSGVKAVIERRLAKHAAESNLFQCSRVVDNTRLEGGIVLDTAPGLYAACTDNDAVCAGASPPAHYASAIAAVSAHLANTQTSAFDMCTPKAPSVVVSYDVEAMYPNIIYESNMSPETKLGTVGAPHVDVERVRAHGPGRWKDAPCAGYHCFILPPHQPTLKHRIVFFKREGERAPKGILARMAGGTVERLARKQLSMVLTAVARVAATESEGRTERIADTRLFSAQVDVLRTTKEPADVVIDLKGNRFGYTAAQIAYAAEEGAKQANTEQLVMKMVLNAMYGVMAYIDKDIARCITAQGRQMNVAMQAHAEAKGGKVVGGVTDSIFVEQPHFSDIQTTFDQAREFAEDVTRQWGGERSKLKVEGVATARFVAKKNSRCEVLYTSPTEHTLKVVGMGGETGVERDMVQRFVQCVMELSTMRLRGVQLILLHTLCECMEKVLARPEDGGYDLAEYATSTCVHQLDNYSAPHLTALKRKCDREGLPISYFKRRTVLWGLRKGPGSVQERARVLEELTWDTLDRGYVLEGATRRFKSDVVDKKHIPSGMPLFPESVFTLMVATYSRALSITPSAAKMGAAMGFAPRGTTPHSRLRLFVDEFMRSSQAKRKHSN